MPIALAAAKQAIATLQGSNAAALFEAMKASAGYLFEKHLNKELALQAAEADEQVKGYFKKVVTTEVQNFAQYKELNELGKGRFEGLPGGAKVKPQSFGKNKNVSFIRKEAMSAMEFATLLRTTLHMAGQGVVGYYRANANVETRFVYITLIPSGYVGRSVDQEGHKEKELFHAVVIIVAEPAKKPFILNFYPADSSYHERQVALV